MARKDSRARSESGVPHHKVLSLEVTGGFLDGTTLELADGLNCIIGERGTGKTTVIELLRFALGLMPNQESPRHKILTKMIQSNLRHGSVRASIETRHGVRYSVERGFTDQAPRVLDEKNALAHVSLDKDLIFGADIYSLNEIEEIATDPGRQLVLLDKFIETDMLEIAEEMRRVRKELETTGGDVVVDEREVRELEETVTQLPGLEQKLAGLQETEGAEAEQINEAHAQKALRDKERRMIEQIEREARIIGGEVDTAVAAWGRRLASRVDSELVEGKNQRILKKVAKPASELCNTLSELAKETRQRLDSLLNACRKQVAELEDAHAQQERDYGELVARSNEARERAAERAKIHRRHAEVASAKKELDERRTQRATRLERRATLMRKLSVLLDRRFALRHALAERLTRQLLYQVQVRMLQSGEREAYRKMLAAAFAGSSLRGIKATIDGIVQNLMPDELVRLLRRPDTAALAERAGLDGDHARKVAELLDDPEMLCKLETVELEDAPTIELLDVKTYKDSNSLSTGQRCTAILSILLLEGSRPLIIDQPEDNLDNGFIFKTVVKSLREVKGVRQVIFVTHNPNIPVLGDAERVFAMASDGQRAHLAAHGTVKELQKVIEDVLEGGKEAFLERWKRYGH